MTYGTFSYQAMSATPFDINQLHLIAALSRQGQMEREGIWRHLKKPNGISSINNNKVNELPKAGA